MLHSLAKTLWKRIAFIRFIHTAIFLFFNVIMAVLLYEVVADKISILTWITVTLFAIEVIVLITNNWTCPLTTYAENLEPITVKSRTFSSCQSGSAIVCLYSMVAC